MGTQLPSPKRGHSPQIFRPCLLWPNGWMDQDATWHTGRPRPGHIVLDRDPAPLPKREGTAHPQFLAHVCCSQTAGWIKMALGMEVSLCPGHTVLNGDAGPLPRKMGYSPQFSAMSIWPNGWMDQDATWYHEGRLQPRPHCNRWGPSSPPPKKNGHSSPNFRPMSVVAKRVDESRHHLVLR